MSKISKAFMPPRRKSQAWPGMPCDAPARQGRNREKAINRKVAPSARGLAFFHSGVGIRSQLCLRNCPRVGFSRRVAALVSASQAPTRPEGWIRTTRGNRCRAGIRARAPVRQVNRYHPGPCLDPCQRSASAQHRPPRPEPTIRPVTVPDSDDPSACMGRGPLGAQSLAARP